MAGSSQRAVKGDVAKLFTVTAFNRRTIFSGVTSFIAVAADNKLIVVDDSAPFTSNIERIRDGWRGLHVMEY